jgi:hypothetical protein
VIKKPQRRRPRPDLGCRTIGWMEYAEVNVETFYLNVEFINDFGRN